MRSEGYGTWSVCLSVHASSCTTGYGAANEWYQWVVNNEKIDIDVAIFLKRLRSRDMASKQAKKPTCGRSFFQTSSLLERHLLNCVVSDGT